MYVCISLWPDVNQKLDDRHRYCVRACICNRQKLPLSICFNHNICICEPAIYLDSGSLTIWPENERLVSERVPKRPCEHPANVLHFVIFFVHHFIVFDQNHLCIFNLVMSWTRLICIPFVNRVSKVISTILCRSFFLPAKFVCFDNR